jgi:hypothetical protein
MSRYIVSLLALASSANAVGLGDVKHVIMLMMENRSFQHVSAYLLILPLKVIMLINTVFWYYVWRSWFCRP